MRARVCVFLYNVHDPVAVFSEDAIILDLLNL